MDLEKHVAELLTTDTNCFGSKCTYSNIIIIIIYIIYYETNVNIFRGEPEQVMHNNYDACYIIIIVNCNYSGYICMSQSSENVIVEASCVSYGHTYLGITVDVSIYNIIIGHDNNVYMYYNYIIIM